MYANTPVNFRYLVRLLTSSSHLDLYKAILRILNSKIGQDLQFLALRRDTTLTLFKRRYPFISVLKNQNLL